MNIIGKNVSSTSLTFLKDQYKEKWQYSSISTLPDNYYDNILRLETLLLQSLDFKLLEELLQLYMTGIEYYEPRDSNKAFGFQSRANWLVSKPEIIQLLQKEEERKKKRETSDLETLNLIKTLKRRISVQKRLSLDQDKDTQHEQCQKIIKDIVSFNEEKKRADSLLQEEFSCQRANLIDRLKQRKALNNATGFSNMISNNTASHNANENNNDVQQSSLFDITETNSNLSFSSVQCSEMSVNIEDLSIDGMNHNHDIEPMMISMNKEGDTPKSKQRKTNETSTFNKSSSTMEHISNLINTHHISGAFGSKQKEMLLLIKEKIDEYLFSYNEYFYEEHYQSITKKIEQLFAEKYRKYIQISKTYQDQIKETQYELMSLSHMKNEQIELIVFSLNEEKDHELSKLDDEYNNLLKEHIGSFKALGFKQNNISVQYFQEKAKLDIYNCLLSLFTA